MIDPLNLILIVTAAALLPFFAVVATSYVKISVVFMLIRNAIGVQNIPPNVAMNALAIILSAYIMAPVVAATSDVFATGQYEFDTVKGLQTAWQAGNAPLKGFLTKHAGEKEKAYFLESARALWPKAMADQLDRDSIIVVLPSFAVAQLREAFEIGLLLYLPFLAIDLIVSNILLSMGMMMVSPLTISLPFKLFLFVMVDGWSRLILGLITSYA